MLVTCPNCAAEYNVPDSLLISGPRKMRCAKCATMFQSHVPVPVEPIITVEEIIATYEPPILSAPVPEDNPHEPDLSNQPAARTNVKRQLATLVAAWVLSLGATGALGWEVIDQRTAVMQAWAPSQRAYLAMGLTAKPGLSAEVGAKPKAEPEAPATSPEASHPG